MFFDTTGQVDDCPGVIDFRCYAYATESSSLQCLAERCRDTPLAEFASRLLGVCFLVMLMPTQFRLHQGGWDELGTGFCSHLMLVTCYNFLLAFIKHYKS